MPTMEMERAKAVSFLVQKDFGMEMHVLKRWLLRKKHGK
jgi:hypothetical protein